MRLKAGIWKIRFLALNGISTKLVFEFDSCSVVIPAKAGIQEIRGTKENLRIPDQVRDDDDEDFIDDPLKV
jgi:hypothetical protein